MPPAFVRNAVESADFGALAKEARTLARRFSKNLKSPEGIREAVPTRTS